MIASSNEIGCGVASTIGGGSTSGAGGGGGAGAAADAAGDALFAGAAIDVEGDALFAGAAIGVEGDALFAGAVDDDVAGATLFEVGAGFGVLCANAIPVEKNAQTNPIVAQACARRDARMAVDTRDM